MAEQRSTQSIEDVLSSIRRLVSDGDGAVSPSDAPTAPVVDKLVLTPQFRVTEPEDPYQTIKALTEAQAMPDGQGEPSLEDAPDEDVLMTEWASDDAQTSAEDPGEIETDIPFISERSDGQVDEAPGRAVEFVPEYEAELSPDAVPEAAAAEESASLWEHILAGRDDDSPETSEATHDAPESDPTMAQVIAMAIAETPADVTPQVEAPHEPESLDVSDASEAEEPTLNPEADDTTAASTVLMLPEERGATLSDVLDDDAMERPLLESIAAISETPVFALAPHDTDEDVAECEAPVEDDDAVDPASPRDSAKTSADTDASVDEPAPDMADTFEAPMGADMPSQDDGGLEAPVSSTIPFPHDKRAQMPANDPSAAPFLGEDEGDVLDEETLREIISEVVREELAGPLGERITRNVRKLVRREIRQMLASEEFD